MSREQESRIETNPQRSIKVISAPLLGLPDAAPSIAYFAGEHYKDADIVRFTISRSPSMLIVSPKAFQQLVEEKVKVDRSPANTRMGEETNTPGIQGPQFESLPERDARREAMREKGKHEKLAHTVVGKMLSALPKVFGEEIDNTAREFVAKNSGTVVNPTVCTREFVQEVIWGSLFGKILTIEEVRKISDFVPESFVPFGTVAFLGKWIKPLMERMYGEIYTERDEILKLLGEKAELALQEHPGSVPVQIWEAFFGEGMVMFDGDEQKSKEYAKGNTAGYLMTLFQAAADTTTGPGGNAIALMGKEENMELLELVENNEEALYAAVYVSLALNSPLPVDPHILIEPWTVGGETFPEGTSIGFDLSSIAKRELEEYTGLSVENSSFYELVARALEIAKENGDSTLDKAKRSFAFKTGVKGACMGNGFAVRELAGLFKAVAGHVETVAEGQQKVGLLLTREDSKVWIH